MRRYLFRYSTLVSIFFACRRTLFGSGPCSGSSGTMTAGPRTRLPPPPVSVLGSSIIIALDDGIFGVDHLPLPRILELEQSLVSRQVGIAEFVLELLARDAEPF